MTVRQVPAPFFRERVSGGENAIKGLNGRYFGGRQISAQPVVDAVYSSLFSRTKAL